MNLARIDELLDYILEVTAVSREEFFQKTRVQHIIEARQLFFYLLRREKVSMPYIKGYMERNGLVTNHSSVLNGYYKFRQMVEEDVNVRKLVNKVSNVKGL